MTVEARLTSLKEKHDEIEVNLQAEENRPYPDESKIHRLKREKLSINDEIQRLTESQVVT